MHLVWLRNNLRLADNPPLYEACVHGGRVRVLYAVTPLQYQRHDDAPCKNAFHEDALNNLVEGLAALGISTDVLNVPLYKDLPKAFEKYAHTHGVTDVWYAREIPIHERQRDDSVRKVLCAQGVRVHDLPPAWLVLEDVRTKAGQPYKVFTPWYRTLSRKLADNLSPPLLPPKAQGPACEPVKYLCSQASFRKDLWPTNGKAVEKRLNTFVQKDLVTYARDRDDPFLGKTSRLSPYLTSGLLSVRQCVWAAWQALLEVGQDPMKDVWIKELAWREFYAMIMWNFSHVSKGRPFREKGVPQAWREDAFLKQSFERGETGFPIVDAAIRQLLETGWMHNRLRMIVASFYCKLLLLPWWEGEAFFMKHLIDGDFASNNGGWQWCASTGCDASPWFRVFNPLRQSHLFDPDGAFIAAMMPSFGSIDPRERHDPSDIHRKRLGYPKPVIDYASARTRALNFYKKAAS